MIEIVFNDSAAGALKCAQRFGKGSYQAEAGSFFVLHRDGHAASKEELQEVRREYDRKRRNEWENAIPLGGSAADVFGFHLALSIGKIEEEEIGEQRKEALEWLFGSFYEGPECVSRFLENGKKNLQRIEERAGKGEAVRIWYSDNPDELCGLYWFMHWFSIKMREKLTGEIEVYLVKLPEWMEREDGAIVRQQSWGEVSEAEWYRYLSQQKKASPNLIRMYAHNWEELKQDNAVVRACINGRLLSVSEDFYDCFIRNEIELSEAEFMEQRVIGKILGNYQLGISDSWFHTRIEKMIQEGVLVVVEDRAEGMPAYVRKLRKVQG